MRFVGAFLVAASLTLATTASFADQNPYPQTDEAYAAELAKLRWKKGPASYQLGRSHSTVNLPAAIEIVTGADAERLAFLFNGAESPETEAIVQSRATTDAIIYVDYYEDGFVTDDDWQDLDPDSLMEDIRAATAAQNDERARNGMSPLYAIGWLIPPTYDAQAKVARFAFEMEQDGERFANVRILKLGRFGYHALTWAGPTRGADGTPRLLQAMTDAHGYDAGFRYADYVEGDELAGFGIAALVSATAAGSKPGKGLIAAILGTALLVLKKGWFLVLGVLGAIGAGIKRFLRRGDDDTGSS